MQVAQGRGAKGESVQTEYLEEFIVLARELSFRRAAEKLHLSHPALSKHIAALENELGFKLFDRSGSTKLTAKGKAYLLYAQRALATLDEGAKYCASIDDAAAPVRVMWAKGVSGILEGIFPRLETPCTFVSPNNAESALSSLDSGHADIAILYNVEDIAEISSEIERDSLNSLFLGQERLTLAMARDNPLASKGALSREDLRGAEIISGFGEFFEAPALAIRHLIGEDLDLRFIYDPLISTNYDFDPLFKLGQGVVVASQSNMGENRRQNADLAFFDELDGQPLYCKEFLIYRSNDPNPNVKAFVEEVRGLVGEGKDKSEGKGSDSQE